MAQEQPEVTDSDQCRILVLDANIMLRAVLGIRVRSLIEKYAEDVSLFIPSACVAEVRDYLPSLCARRNWDSAAAANLLDTLLTLVRIVEQDFYSDFEQSAKRRIGVRDIDDWPVAALALALGAEIWTEDTDFFGSGIATWTTDTVEIYLRNDPWQINEPAFTYNDRERISESSGAPAS
jgi:predicted nucleic acid-binding protein